MMMILLSDMKKDETKKVFKFISTLKIVHVTVCMYVLHADISCHHLFSALDLHGNWLDAASWLWSEYSP